MPEDYGPYHDYETRPIGGGNPYYCCSACGISDPQINGTLSGHASHCSWVKAKRAELAGNEMPAILDLLKEMRDWMLENEDAFECGDKASRIYDKIEKFVGKPA